MIEALKNKIPADLDRAFANGGECGRILREMDWSKHPLGPISEWPQSLRTAVCITLECGLSTCISWGSDWAKTINIYNDVSIETHGKRHPNALGRHPCDVWPEVWDHFLGPAMKQVYETAKPLTVHETFFVLERRGFREEVYSTNCYSPVRDESGKVGGAFVTIVTTTERVRSERRFRTLSSLSAGAAQAESEMQVYSAMRDAVAGNRADFPFALYYSADPKSREARLQFSVGLPDGSVAAPALVSLASKGSNGSYEWPLSGVLQSGLPETFDSLESRFSSLLVEGLQSPLALPQKAHILPLISGSGEPYGFLIVGLNPLIPPEDSYPDFLKIFSSEAVTAISKQRAVEEARQRAEKLAEIDRAKTTFFNNISHEFRTPLTLLLGPIEDLLRDAPAESREVLQSMRRNALRLLKLVSALLDFSRVEAGKMQPNFEATDLMLFTRNLSSMFESAFQKAGLKLVCKFPDFTEAMWIDRDMWEKIVLNLLSNALKYTLKGNVEVALCPDEDGIQFVVADTGAGIPADVLPHVFERFYRHKNDTSRSVEGTGIGLAMVQELVKLHGGRVEVSSEVGKGSRFTVHLRRGSEHLDPAQMRCDVRGLPTPSASATVFVEEAEYLLGISDDEVKEAIPEQKSTSRVLIVDDNRDMRDYLARILSPHYSLQLAANGSEALKLVSSGTPDLILSDVMMPGLDGFALLSEIRAMPEAAHVPFLLLSARAGEESTLEGLSSGADDYLIKPFSARELLARIRTHLELARSRRVAAESELKDNFMVLVAHELKTPLTGLRLGLELLDREITKSDFKGVGALQKTGRSLNRMESLVNDLLNVSLAKQEGPRLQMSQADLRSLVQDCMGEFDALTAQRIRVRLPDGELRVFADKQRVAEVLQRLLSNALKFSAASQAVDLEVEQGASRVRFSIQDRGPGIPADDAKHLFESFYKIPGVEVFAGSRVGLGMGLFLSKMIVEAHGGKIWAESNPGQGSRFSFEIPINDPGSKSL
jgi:signal transduction histidine kinase